MTPIPSDVLSQQTKTVLINSTKSKDFDTYKLAIIDLYRQLDKDVFKNDITMSIDDVLSVSEYISILQSRLADSTLILLTDLNRKLIGIAEYILNLNKPTASIKVLVIDKEFRGKGYGTYFLNKVISTIKLRHTVIKYVLVTSYASNKVANKMYVESGFKIRTYTMQLSMDSLIE